MMQEKSLQFVCNFYAIILVMRRTIEFSAEDEDLIEALQKKQTEESGQSSATAALRWALRLAYKLKVRGKQNG